ncbi:MAG: hypothetical protein ABGY09_01840 [Euryarchaeota archaeon]
MDAAPNPPALATLTIALLTTPPALGLTGSLSADLTTILGAWREATQHWTAGDAPVLVIPTDRPASVFYLPDHRLFLVTRPDLRPEVVPRPNGTLLVRTPAGTLEYHLKPPILLNYATVILPNRLCTVNWMNQRGRPSVWIKDLRTGTERTYEAPFRLTELLPGPLERADVEYHLAPDHCTLTYYLVSEKAPDRYLELTINVPREGRPELHARVVRDPRRALELRRILREPDELKRLARVIDWCLAHTPEGAKPIWLSFRPPEDAPLTTLLKRLEDLCEVDLRNPVTDVPVLDLLTWWLEWRLRWPNVRLLPGTTDRERAYHSLLTQPWLALAPDALTIATALPTTLTLTWLYRRALTGVRAEGPLPTRAWTLAIRYTLPLLAEELLVGRLALPWLIRATVTTLLTPLLPGTRIPTDRLIERALSGVVRPIADTLAIRLGANLTGSPELAALIFAGLAGALRTEWRDTLAGALAAALLPPPIAAPCYAAMTTDAWSQHFLLYALTDSPLTLPAEATRQGPKLLPINYE